ncbi:CBS domain-containing membrane protein [Oxalobacteraceae bacterium GrIS 1.11]
MKLFLQRWLPHPHNGNLTEQFRSCAGAICGLLATGLCSHFLLARDGAAMYLVAPMGASAVLLFCLPASPLAQPWSVIGGNVVSGLVGAACVRWLGADVMVAGLATCLAIAAMFALRCLHPPGGAVALTTVMGGATVHAAGFGFALVPVLINSSILVGCAILYNNLSGRRYPHTQQISHPNPHATADRVPSERLGFTPADMDAVLRQYNQVLDVSRDDLESIFLQTEMHAYQRRFGVIRCADIMSKDVLSVEFGTELGAAWSMMRAHKIKALPVLNRTRRVIGIISQGDFFEHVDLDDYRGMRRKLHRFLRRSGVSHTEKPEVVGQIMRRQPRSATLATPIVDLLSLMVDAGLHSIPVLDEQARLAGIVTQSDLMAALYESRFAEDPQPAP